jgi:hypothetical protein
MVIQGSRLNDEGRYSRQLDPSIGLDDVIKVYDNFFRDHFKNHPKFSEIQAEYSEFKNELVQLANDLSDEDFQTYAQRKGSFMRSRISQLCVIPPQHAVSANPQFIISGVNHSKKNFFLDFIRGTTVSERQFDDFSSTFRNMNIREIVRDGMIANLTEFGKSQQPIMFREIKKSTDIAGDLAIETAEVNSIISLLRLAEKQHARVIDFSTVEEYNPLVNILVAVFVTSLEKPLHSFRLITDYLMDLYNLSQLYSVKTTHQTAFDRFSRYIQQVLQEATTKNFESDASYHGYVLGLFYRTLHHPDVLKGIKLYVGVSIKVFLDFMNPTLILSILGINPTAVGAENPSSVRAQLLDFITNHIEREPKFTKGDEVAAYLEINKPKILKIIKLAGYCLSGSFECATFFASQSGPFTVSSPYKNESENSFVICVPIERKAILGYGDHSKQLLEILKKTEPAYGIEDFLSVSENESSSGRLTPPPMERSLTDLTNSLDIFLQQALLGPSSRQG